ncbi:MAG TPA: GNAT family N-acetyltransferase [Sphingomicrobium sp.]|nr:GNAT family N-acetyltransferase [Sphingomicrobium sp.]
MIFSYRDAVPDDAATLDRIFDTSFRDAFGQLYRPEDLGFFLSSFGIADWERELQDGECAFRIAEADDVPVGYAKIGPLKLPLEPGAPAMMLHQLYLLKDYHGVGIAHGLMDWVLEEARRRGAREVYLTVFIDNHRAKRFYERYGFVAVGRYDFMVGKQADEDIVMKKFL